MTAETGGTASVNTGLARRLMPGPKRTMSAVSSSAPALAAARSRQSSTDATAPTTDEAVSAVRTALLRFIDVNNSMGNLADSYVNVVTLRARQVTPAELGSWLGKFNLSFGTMCRETRRLSKALAATWVGRRPSDDAHKDYLKNLRSAERELKDLETDFAALTDWTGESLTIAERIHTRAESGWRRATSLFQIGSQLVTALLQELPRQAIDLDPRGSAQYRASTLSADAQMESHTVHVRPLPRSQHEQ